MSDDRRDDTRDDEFTPARPRLPDLALAPMAGGDAVAARARRTGTVLVLLAGALRERDAAYLRALAAAHDGLRGWDGRVLVVAPDDAPRVALEALALPFPLLLDPRGAIAAAAKVAAPAVVVSDQWGEVHAARGAGGDDAWLGVAEVEQWLRWMAIRCAG